MTELKVEFIKMSERYVHNYSVMWFDKATPKELPFDQTFVVSSGKLSNYRFYRRSVDNPDLFCESASYFVKLIVLCKHSSFLGDTLRFLFIIITCVNEFYGLSESLPPPTDK